MELPLSGRTQGLSVIVVIAKFTGDAAAASRSGEVPLRCAERASAQCGLPLERMLLALLPSTGTG